MTDMNTAHDESMEEILASIRRIIADDGPAQTPQQPQRPAHQNEPARPVNYAVDWQQQEPAYAAPDNRQPRPVQHAPAGDAHGELEILDLSEEFLVAEGDFNARDAGFAEAESHFVEAPREQHAHTVQPDAQHLEAPVTKWRLWDGQAPIRAASPQAPAAAPEPESAPAAAFTAAVEAEPQQVEEPEPVREAEPAAEPQIAQQPADELEPAPVEYTGPAIHSDGAAVHESRHPAMPSFEVPAEAAAIAETPVHAPAYPAAAHAPRPPYERPQNRGVWSRRAEEEGSNGASARYARPQAAFPDAPKAAEQDAPATRAVPPHAAPEPIEFPPAPSFDQQPAAEPAGAPMQEEWANGYHAEEAQANAPAEFEPFPAETQESAAEPASVFVSFTDDEDDSDIPADRGYLKAIAAELARATIGSLGDKELRDANRVDFTQMTGAPMDTVKDSFANAMAENGDPQRAAMEHPAPEPARYAPEPRPEPMMYGAHQQFTPLPAAVGRTLEDSFRELLRPMILEWLDQNLPRLLDEAVQQEVRRRMGGR
jgi:hypothetical protein